MTYRTKTENGNSKGGLQVFLSENHPTTRYRPSISECFIPCLKREHGCVSTYPDAGISTLTNVFPVGLAHPSTLTLGKRNRRDLAIGYDAGDLYLLPAIER